MGTSRALRWRPLPYYLLHPRAAAWAAALPRRAAWRGVALSQLQLALLAAAPHTARRVAYPQAGDGSACSMQQFSSGLIFVVEKPVDCRRLEICVAM